MSTKFNLTELQNALPVGFEPPKGPVDKNKKKRRNAKKKAENDIANEVHHEAGQADEFLVNKFEELGFQREAARQTLIVNRNDFDQTLSMLQAAGASVLIKVEAETPNRRRLDVTGNDEGVARLLDMGFPISETRHVLHEVGGNLQQAIDLLVQRNAAPASAPSYSSNPPRQAAQVVNEQPHPPSTSQSRNKPQSSTPATLLTSSASWAGPKAAPTSAPAPNATNTWAPQGASSSWPAASSDVSARKATPSWAGSTATVKTLTEPAVATWKVGDECEGLYSEDKQWYHAVIEHISADGSQFSVVYPEYGNREELTSNLLRPLAKSSAISVKPPAAVAPVVTTPKASSPTFKVGDLVEGCFTEDDVWYVARITHITADGKYGVTYVDYGNSEEIPLSRLRLAADDAPAAQATEVIAPVSAPAAVPFKPGDEVQAQSHKNDVWYKAIVTDITPDYKQFSVAYKDYASNETLPFARVKPLSASVPEVAASLAPYVAHASSTLPPLQPGSIVEAQFSEDKNWYTATIEDVSPDGQLITVTYVEYGNSEVLPISSIRSPTIVSQTIASPPVVTASSNTLAIAAQTPISAPVGIRPAVNAYAVGQLVEGQYTEDDNWYEARIDAIQPGGQFIQVTYTQYGNSEALPISRLRVLPAAAATAAAPAAASVVAQPIVAAANRAPSTVAAPSQYITPAAVVQPPSKAVLPIVSAPIAFAAHDVVEAKYSGDGLWYRAQIVGRAADQKRFTVVFTEYGNSEDVAIEDLRHVHSPPTAAPALAVAPPSTPAVVAAPVAVSPIPIVQAPAANPAFTWTIGAACEAQFEDGIWYAAVITAVSPATSTVTVTYTEYGNTEELTLDRLRQKEALPSASSINAPRVAVPVAAPVLGLNPSWAAPAAADFAASYKAPAQPANFQSKVWNGGTAPGAGNVRKAW